MGGAIYAVLSILRERIRGPFPHVLHLNKSNEAICVFLRANHR